VAVDLLDFQSAARAERPEAIALFTGRFLQSVSFPGGAAFEQWADLERARADGLLLHAAGAIVQQALHDGRPAAAMDAARQTRALLGQHHGGWRLFLETCLAVGDRPLALIESDVLEQSLRDEDLAPEPALAATLNRLRRSAATSRVRRDFESEFVGREEEFAALLRVYHASVGGKPQHAHLSGAAGFGKSRLLHELADRFRALRARVAQVSAVPSDRSLPFALLARVAETVGALPGAASVGQGSAAVLTRLAPALSSAFHTTGIAPESESALARTQALRELIEATAGERHLVLMVDDLHWGDHESLDALQRVADRLPTNVLMVTTARPPVALYATSTAESRVLSPLTEAQVYAMLVGLGYSATAEDDGALAKAVSQASGGSPLLVLQLVRQGLEEGWLLREGERLESAPGTDLSRALESADPIAQRLRDLPGREAEALQLLAIVGVPVDEGVLSEVMGAAVQGTVQSLASRGLLTAETSGWSCAHDLIRERVIARYTREENRVASARLGRVLVRDATTIARARVGARLLVEGGDQGSLQDLVVRHVRESRASGQDRTARAVAQELMGTSQTESELRALLQSVPLTLRFTRRVWAVVSVMLMVSAVSGAMLLSADRAPALFITQQPVVERPTLVDPGSHDIRPSLVVEQRDHKGQVVDRPSDIIDVIVPDSISGGADTTSVRMTGGRAVFASLRSRGASVRHAVVRRRGSEDSLLLRIAPPSVVTIRLRLVAYRTEAGTVTQERPTLRVPPGARVEGVLQVVYTTELLDETIVYAWTTTWGDAASFARTIGVLSTPFTDRAREDFLRFDAPNAAGEYFVIVVAGTETNEKFLLSRTNWVMGEPRWGDGNDIARLPRESLLRGLGGEEVPGTILRRHEGEVKYLPEPMSLVVIRVVVDPAIASMRVE